MTAAKVMPEVSSIVSLDMKGCIGHFEKFADTPFHIQGDAISLLH